MYSVGTGGVAGISMKGHDELKFIAAETGGRAFFPSRPTDLPNVYDVLANDAQLRYLVTYTPTNQKRDGSWRMISISDAGREPRRQGAHGILRAGSAAGSARS